MLSGGYLFFGRLFHTAGPLRKHVFQVPVEYVKRKGPIVTRSADCKAVQHSTRDWKQHVLNVKWFEIQRDWWHS